MNTGAGYGWSSLNQWETPIDDTYIKRKVVETGLSKSVYRFMLVNRIDQGNGYLRCKYVKKADVTQEILDAAGEI